MTHGIDHIIYAQFSPVAGFHVNSLMGYLFLAGYGIHAQLRCEIPWESQIIQLSGGQPLGAKNHRLWAPVI